LGDGSAPSRPNTPDSASDRPLTEPVGAEEPAGAAVASTAGCTAGAAGVDTGGSGVTAGVDPVPVVVSDTADPIPRPGDRRWIGVLTPVGVSVTL
jgi:hypothetical protein